MSIQILMPALSPGMTEGTLSKWHKKPGEQIARGEVIAEIETDKTTLDLEAVDDGVLSSILVAEGTQAVPIHTPVALLDKLTPAAGERVRASPSARRIAAQSSFDLRSLSGSGPGGRILRSDVERAVAAHAPQSGTMPAPESTAVLPYLSVPISSTRRTIAKRLVASKSPVPHFYLTADYRVDALLAARTAINIDRDSSERISMNDFVIRACAFALRDVPEINAAWTEQEIRQYRSVDIAVAIAAPEGLVAPVIRNAESLSLAQISKQMRDLALRARDRKLAPRDLEGGGFSISNLGMFGVKAFSAIINPPHAATLAVGAAEQRPDVDAGVLAIATVLTCTLSCDHRIIDGSVGARFLQALRTVIDEPSRLLS